MPTSNRGRPVILDKVELELGNGASAVMRLVGDGSTVQVELPKSWTLQNLQRSVTLSGGRTKVAFVQDVAEAAQPPAPAAKPEPKSEPAPVVAEAPAPRAKRTRKRAASAVAA